MARSALNSGHPSGATLAQIAEATGVSISTASRVLSGTTQPTHPSTVRRAERIRQVARELNYQPNPLGRALVGGRSMSIGLLGVALNTPIQLMDISEIESLASADGYQLFLIARDVGIDRDLTERILRDLIARRVDGLILHRPDSLPRPIVRLLVNQPVPIVFAQQAEPLAKLNVCVDQALAIRELARHMAKLGHRQALYIGSQWDWTHPSVKLDLYREAWREQRMQLLADRRWVLGDKTQHGHGPQGYAVVRQLLQHVQPTALILIDDDAAMGALAAIHDAGLRVPEDISVVGYDDVPNASIARPALTTIHQPRGEVGQAAYRLLRQHLGDPSDTPQRVEIANRLVIRDSVGPARTAQPIPPEHFQVYEPGGSSGSQR